MATLDREEQAAYTLIAVAKDGGGRSCQTEISVHLGDVNDNAPVFSSPHYDVSVSERTAVGSLLTHVQATDSDLGEHISKDMDLLSAKINALYDASTKQSEKDCTLDARCTFCD